MIVRIPFLGVLSLLIQFLLTEVTVAQISLSRDGGFVGTATCAGCHSNEFHKWQKSHHSKSMMVPNERTVLGDFKNKTEIIDGVETTFSQNGKGYFIKTWNAQKQLKTYKVAYTFGYTPLQQYLLDVGDGKLQAFGIAWDSRPATSGGQRWFKLLANENTQAGGSLHWTRQAHNWNSRCSECHSTGVTKGYKPASHSYQTSFSDISVGCESCHGPGKKHVALVKSNTYQKIAGSGFGTNLEETRKFLNSVEKHIAKPIGRRSNAQINACGGCHSRRQVIGKIDPAQDYHNQYRLRFLDQGLYHADGQIKDEVFVLGSFLQSKMHQAGVTCTNCHDAHTGMVKAKDNSLCTQCHQSARYDDATHHHHEKSSQGAQCVNCHMPATTYMEIDNRRDHSFGIPNPDLSTKLSVPNACTQCHKSQSNQWASSALAKWQGVTNQNFGLIVSKGRNGDIRNLRAMISVIENQKIAPIKRATLMTLAANVPSRLTANALLIQLKSDNPLMRRAGVEASQIFPIQQRWAILKNLMNDSSASVRFEVARQMAAYAPRLRGAEKTALTSLVDEHNKQLQFSQDTPAGQAAISRLKSDQGDLAGAVKALKNSLEIEPNFVPALLNLADIYRAINDEVQAGETLEIALAVAADNAAVQYSYGLYQVRNGKTKEALKHFENATKLESSSTRYFYAYALAQESLGQIAGAISTLKQANQNWPNQYDILLTLINYLVKSGRENESWKYMSNLSMIAPTDPKVKRLIKKLRK